MSPSGELRLLGRILGASNETFLAADEQDRHWVYKPVVGEKELWDFPEETLGRREVAAFEVSAALGLGVVPVTLWAEGPLGEGSVQEFIDGETCDVVDLLRPEELTHEWMPVASGVDQDGRPMVLAHRDDPRLRSMALFDALINNSDRKVGHIVEAEGRLFGVDHGVSMHVDDKLRTVLWGFAGEPLSDDDRHRLHMATELTVPLSEGLADEEWECLQVRAERLLNEGRYPTPSEEWPPIPWPPF